MAEQNNPPPADQPAQGGPVVSTTVASTGSAMAVAATAIALVALLLLFFGGAWCVSEIKEATRLVAAAEKCAATATDRATTAEAEVARLLQKLATAEAEKCPPRPIRRAGGDKKPPVRELPPIELRRVEPSPNAQASEPVVSPVPQKKEGELVFDRSEIPVITVPAGSVLSCTGQPQQSGQVATCRAKE